MDQVNKKKIANNILEFLVNPRAFPVERRLYFRSEEILDNASYENAVAEADEAYGDQGHNSDFYPNRNRSTKREALSMDRKTLIASMDILSQNFTEESDPMAKDLRTMAYAISKMTDEEYQGRVTEAGMPPWLMKDDKGNVVKNPDFKKKDKKKAEETEPESKEAAEEETVSTADFWSKEASDAVQRALISDVVGDVKANGDEDEKEEKDDDDDGGEKPEASSCKKAEEDKEAGKKEGPGVPDGTGPMKDSPECPKKEEKKAKEEIPEEKKPEEKKPEEKPVEAEEKKAEEPVAEEKEAKEPEAAVDTDILATVNVDGIELTAGMTTMDDIGDLSDEESSRLGQLFQ